tara:strand:+ start:6679 stop:6921 length:243 start_codon:yes stop_codon:yes gene_type:complete
MKVIVRLTKQRLKQIIKEELSKLLESDWYTDQDETRADYKYRMGQRMDDPEYLASLERDDVDPDILSRDREKEVSKKRDG